MCETAKFMKEFLGEADPAERMREKTEKDIRGASHF